MNFPTGQTRIFFILPNILIFHIVFIDVSRQKKRKSKSDHFKQRFRKNFTTLLEEEVSTKEMVRTTLFFSYKLNIYYIIHFLII